MTTATTSTSKTVTTTSATFVTTSTPKTPITQVAAIKYQIKQKPRQKSLETSLAELKFDYKEVHVACYDWDGTVCLQSSQRGAYVSEFFKKHLLAKAEKAKKAGALLLVSIGSARQTPGLDFYYSSKNKNLPCAPVMAQEVEELKQFYANALLDPFLLGDAYYGRKDGTSFDYICQNAVEVITEEYSDRVTPQVEKNSPFPVDAHKIWLIYSHAHRYRGMFASGVKIHYEFVDDLIDNLEGINQFISYYSDYFPQDFDITLSQAYPYKEIEKVHSGLTGKGQADHLYRERSYEIISLANFTLPPVKSYTMLLSDLKAHSSTQPSPQVSQTTISSPTFWKCDCSCDIDPSCGDELRKSRVYPAPQQQGMK